ncbi:MAG: hypothetical protein JXA46_16670 [Dehalococcoidales bacterium]|nr:hypothetical protein [Dehalococcoidales bacterium]
MAEKMKHLSAAVLLAVLALNFMTVIPASAGGSSTWASMNGGTTADLYCIWGTDSNNIYAVGQSGVIVHYNGSSWRPMDSGTNTDLYCVWGTQSGDVFAVGKGGVILYNDGSGWDQMISGTTADLHGVWGSDFDNVYAVGKAGTILNFKGSDWVSESDVTAWDLYSVWGAGGNVFAAGQSGTIIYHDGSAWSTMISGTASDLYCVWGTSRRNVYAVGSSGTFLNYNGSVWDTEAGGITGNLLGIQGADRRSIFIVGESGAIAWYDGSTLSSMNRNTISRMQSVLGFSSADAFAVGAEGTILRYLPPAITSISLAEADQGENLEVTISGLNLTGASEVRFGAGIAVNSFTVISDEQIKANIYVAGGAPVGARDVSVDTPGGSSTLSGGLTVREVLPTINSISPGHERQNTTLNVTIGGTDLTGSIDVWLGEGIAVNSFKVLSPTQITANITIAADANTGTRDVVVTTPVGSLSLPGSFTVKQTLPTISSISPTQGNRETSLTVTIEGTSLTGTGEVHFGDGIRVDSFSVLSPNQIAASIYIDAGAATGERDVSLSTPGGTFILPNSFTVKQALPSIVTIIPDSGSQGATISVAITGTNLNKTSQLRMGTGIAVNSFTVLDSNRMTASITIVAGTETGVRDVSVTTPGGGFILPNSFTVQQGLPVITSISPESGAQGETVTVIISGSNLGGATSVNFGTGVEVKGFTNVSLTQLRASILIDEEAVTGLRDVSVTTPGGISTLSNRFNIKEKPMGVLFIALIWAGIAAVIGLFIFIIAMLRKQRALAK